MPFRARMSLPARATVMLLSMLALAGCAGSVSHPAEGPSTDEPEAVFVSGTSTVLTRLDPWADPALRNKEIYETVEGCYRDSYRTDRVNCATSLTCYLDSGETLGACQVIDQWEVFRIEGIKQLPTSSADPQMSVEMLRLTDGSYCRLHTGAGPPPPEGFDGWSGSCRDGEDVLWSKRQENPPLGAFFIFDPVTDDGYLRVAAGPAEGEPAYYDVAEIYY